MKFWSGLVTAIVALFATSGLAQADYAPPGSYQRTCSDIAVTWNTLSASCRTRWGNWNYTTLRNYRDCDGDIANRDGRLECVGDTNDDDQNDDDYGGWLPMGSYRSSCRNITIENGTLIAECRDNYGRWRYTELAGYRSCRDIANSNGMLRCRRDYDDGDEDGYDDGRLPGGSWRATCRNGRVYGNVLYATCRDRYGNWQASTLDLRYCRYNVSNENGRLVCGGAGGGGYSRITIYRHTNYIGASRTFSTDVADLSAYGFSNITSSVVVQGGVWQLCDKPNYRGYCVILDRSQSNLWAFGFNDRTESIRRIR
jgi:hypothetical protein